MKKLKKIPCITVNDLSETGLTVVADDGYALQLKKPKTDSGSFRNSFNRGGMNISTFAFGFTGYVMTGSQGNPRYELATK